MKTYDFRGQGGWGHAMHHQTWRELPPRTKRVGFLWLKRVPVARRASVLAHVNGWPTRGDRLLATFKSGECSLLVVDSERCPNVSDMFELTLEFEAQP